MAVMFCTIDELILINSSIRNKDYLKDLEAYKSTYEEVLVNAFITFLALKGMNLDEIIMNTLSQSIFNQIKVIALIH